MKHKKIYDFNWMQKKPRRITLNKLSIGIVE